MSQVYPTHTHSAVKPDFAKEFWPCPQARLFSQAYMPKGLCIGDACPLWRWIPLLTTENGFVNAVKKAQASGMTAQQATKDVSENRAKYGLPDKPWRGWCGLAEAPRA